ncbi:MAG TPA: hypothetical protein VM100_07370, partial [Longimicrobiales bacterium]|nr:hypothetical protein [Longimicrobiales bacterium]
LDARFSEWVDAHVIFCNTLVDRIVPGGLSGVEAEDAWDEIGYQDEMLTVCEPYRLFAIESVKPLEFAGADPNIIICDDIAPYRERKVRLLNGTHTIMVPAALLAGCETVRDAMEDEEIGSFVRRVLFEELVPSINAEGAEEFANDVVERFLNPYIKHALLDITLQQTMKLRVRIVPAIVELASRGHSIDAIAFGFAAYLELLSRDIELREDSLAHSIRSASGQDIDDYVRAACGNTDVWGVDLNTVGDFATRVTEHLRAMRVHA